MTFYAYLHARPNTEDASGIFYVGKGKDKRAYDLNRPNKHHSSVINKHGKENILVSLIECSSEQIAFDLEVGLIKCLARMGVALSNKTAGGDGVRGFVKSEEWRKNHSKMMTGRSNWAKGRTVPEEQRRKISNTLKVASIWKGRRHTEDSKLKMAVNKGTKLVNKDGVVVRILSSEIDLYLSNGWCLGRKSSQCKIKKSVVGNERKGRLYITDGHSTKCIRVPMLPPTGWAFGQTRKKGNR